MKTRFANLSTSGPDKKKKMVTDSDEVWQLLVSHGKLDRDKGVARVQEEVAAQSATVTDLIQKLEAFRIDNGQEKTPWETKLGILLGSKAIVSGALTTITDSFLQCCLERCKLLLTDEEGEFFINKIFKIRQQLSIITS